VVILKIHWPKSEYVMGLKRNRPEEADVRTFFAQQPAPTVDWRDIARVTIDVLHDIALLEIFDFYVDGARMERWRKLVRVCRKWRNLVFGSPRRLKLQLFCGKRTRVREMLDIWPPLPVFLRALGLNSRNMKNISEALELNDRICHLDLTGISSSRSEEVLSAIRRPFPLLKHLKLQVKFHDETMPIDPDSFLGGSAPRLRSLSLNGIPVSGLPNLLLTTNNLVRLELFRIPEYGYGPPEAMATCISMLTKLKSLAIVFVPPQGRPDRKSRHPHPQTRILLPSLTMWRFRGFSEYLEDLVAGIDAPLLDNLKITFFHQSILDSPQLTQFISRTPKFKIYDEKEARVVFFRRGIEVTLFDGALELAIAGAKTDQPEQIASLAQACISFFPQSLISAVEDLYFLDNDNSPPPSSWQDDVNNSEWQEVFHPFTGVKNLFLPAEFAPSIAFTLPGPFEGSVTEVLPALQTFFWEDTAQSFDVPELIRPFIAARKLVGHPVALSRWKKRVLW
jgi:hypothetical protein